MKILVVAMPNSIHTARWLKQFDGDNDLQIALFPSTMGGPKEGLSKWKKLQWFLLNIVPYERALVSHLPWRKLNGAFHLLLKQLYGPSWRARWLAKTIKRLKPDIIHSLEFQNAGYACLEARKILGDNFPTWIATNWGSDIYLYARLPGHLDLIKDILEKANYYSAECLRDYDLAKQIGLKASPLPVIPNSGGFHLEELEKRRKQKKPSERNVIIIKGYQLVFGRALTAVKALELISEEIKRRNMEVHIVSVTEDIEVSIELTAQKTGLNIQVYGIKTPLTHDQILEIKEKSRIYVGISISDGISTSMLEAMTLGAFPIQTCTACANEWIEHGRTGFIAQSYDNAQEIADLLLMALEDDDLVNAAADQNWKTIQEKADYNFVKKIARSFYDTAYHNKAS